MSEVKNVPEIRFAEFTNAWEQRKLEECFKIRNEKNGDRYTREDVLAVSDTYGCVNQIEFHGRSFASEDISNYKIVRKGDIIYTKSPLQAKPYGIIKIVGNETGIISPLYVVNEAVDNIDSMYMYYLFDTPERTNNYLCPLVRKGAKNTMNISNSEWLSGEVTISPDKQEQQLIGTFFRHLDNLITLHQRKHDKLAVLKKAMLEKMFPQNGSSVPEVRFAGFTGPWEQRKLSEIADKVTEKNVGLQYIETFTNSAEFGIISQRDFFDHDIAKMSSLDGYYIVRNEDFVYNPRISTAAPVGPINRNKLSRVGVMSPLYTVFRPHDVDTTYLEYFFKSKYWHSFMNFNGDSGARSDRFSIKDSVFFEMPIPIPHIDEQRKIGAHLTNLDHLISLHQRKHESLKHVKAALLQKMFV